MTALTLIILVIIHLHKEYGYINAPIQRHLYLYVWKYRNAKNQNTFFFA